MIFGKEMAQPSIVFTGKKGLKCITEIMNAKPVDKEYELSIRQSSKSEGNQDRLKESIKEVEAGHYTAHELIDVDD